jgi:hypothetical protein
MGVLICVLADFAKLRIARYSRGRFEDEGQTGLYLTNWRRFPAMLSDIGAGNSPGPLHRLRYADEL